MAFQPIEGMDLDLGSSSMEVQDAGSSWIDGADSEAFGMNVMSAYPSKELKTGEEQVNFDNIPLLSYICEMDYLVRRFGEKVKFDREMVSGKYILFYSFFQPPKPFKVMSLYHPMDLFNLCTDLYSVRDDFEMVYVAKSEKEDNYDLALQGFFTCAPTYSLVVPAKESHRRNFMCECLGLVYPGTFKCLLVNVKKGIVVRGHLYSMSHLTEQLQKLQKESSFDGLRSYQRIFKTLWPVIPKEQKNPFPPIGSCPIAKKLMNVKLEYGDHINEMVSESKKLSPIKIGQSVDVISFLAGKDDVNYLCRNDGKTERVEVDKQTFSGKYILVCCFHLPVFRQELNARRAQAIATACSELYSSRGDFEMVVVAKMNQLANYEVFFNRFMSGFPPSCLVVPFQHSKQRDFICKYLDLAASECGDIKCLIFDKDTDIKRDIVYFDYPDFALDYGANAFPFTDEKLLEVSANDHLWWNDDLPPAKLEDLLGCNLSDVLNKKTVSPAVHEHVTILELSSKVVGVYVCIKGNLVPTLGKVYQQCRAQGLDFEIVLVYVPWVYDSLDPQVHITDIERVLLEWNISWCWFPQCFDRPDKLFNSSVSCRVRRCIDGHLCDHIIIVGQHGTFVEPYGAEVMSMCGIDVYPFGRDAIFEMKMKKFEKHTLESLLVYGPRDYVYKDKKRIPVSELMGKKIILYLGDFGDLDITCPVNYWYFGIKENYDPDVEVVQVSLHDYECYTPKNKEQLERLLRMRDLNDLRASEYLPCWYVCPFDPRHSTLLEELFMGGSESYAVVVFGADGRVCSTGAFSSYSSSGPKGLQFDKSDLRRDILDSLKFQRRMMCASPGPTDCS